MSGSLVKNTPKTLKGHQRTIERHSNISVRFLRKNLSFILGIDYRKPYATTHSAATHALAVMSAGEVAEMTGHSIRVLLKDYAGSIANNRTLPEL